MDKKKPQRCQKRLPTKKVGGWKFSLLCQLPLNHEGPCPDDDTADILTRQVIPEIQKRYPPPKLIG